MDQPRRLGFRPVAGYSYFHGEAKGPEAFEALFDRVTADEANNPNLNVLLEKG